MKCPSMPPATWERFAKETTPASSQLLGSEFEGKEVLWVTRRLHLIDTFRA